MTVSGLLLLLLLLLPSLGLGCFGGGGAVEKRRTALVPLRGSTEMRQPRQMGESRDKGFGEAAAVAN